MAYIGPVIISNVLMQVELFHQKCEHSGDEKKGKSLSYSNLARSLQVLALILL